MFSATLPAGPMAPPCAKPCLTTDTNIAYPAGSRPMPHAKLARATGTPCLAAKKIHSRKKRICANNTFQVTACLSEASSPPPSRNGAAISVTSAPGPLDQWPRSNGAARRSEFQIAGSALPPGSQPSLTETAAARSTPVPHHRTGGHHVQAKARHHWKRHGPRPDAGAPVRGERRL